MNVPKRPTPKPFLQNTHTERNGARIPGRKVSKP